MAEQKNICGKIPLELHTKVREEIERIGISIQEFIQQVIEEHFMEKGVVDMATRTIAVQVSEELYQRLKTAVAKKGCKQKEFLIAIIEKALNEVEVEIDSDVPEESENTIRSEEEENLEGAGKE